MQLKKKILVVDDEASILQVCLRVLTDLGFDVDTAGDGQAAFNHVLRENGAYEMVITDVKMPKMDGPQLVHMVKRRYPAIDVIVMTGFPDIETAVDTLKGGAYDYILKPFDIDLLSAVVNRCWEKRQMAESLSQEKSQRQSWEALLARANGEVREPLTALLQSLKSLEENKEQAGAGELISKAKQAAARLNAEIETLLAFYDRKQKS